LEGWRRTVDQLPASARSKSRVESNWDGVYSSFESFPAVGGVPSCMRVRMAGRPCAPGVAGVEAVEMGPRVHLRPYHSRSEVISALERRKQVNTLVRAVGCAFLVSAASALPSTAPSPAAFFFCFNFSDHPYFPSFAVVSFIVSPFIVSLRPISFQRTIIPSHPILSLLPLTQPPSPAVRFESVCRPVAHSAVESISSVVREGDGITCIVVLRLKIIHFRDALLVVLSTIDRSTPTSSTHPSWLGHPNSSQSLPRIVGFPYCSTDIAPPHLLVVRSASCARSNGVGCVVPRERPVELSVVELGHLGSVFLDAASGPP